MSQRCGQTLVDLFQNGAHLNSENIAVIYDDGKEKQIMTYRQLCTAVQRVCSPLMFSRVNIRVVWLLSGVPSAL